MCNPSDKSSPGIGSLERMVRQFGGGGWIKREEFDAWLSQHGVVRAEKLTRDNRTDGEIHQRCRHAESGKTFDFNGNWYSAETWRPLMEWVLKLPNTSIEGTDDHEKI